MNRTLSVLTIVFLVGIFSLYSASAFCTINGYARNSTGDFVGYDSAVYCENLGTWENLSNPSSAGYQALFGTFSGSCQSVCGNVWVTCSNSTLSISGHPSEGYPLNSTTTANWAVGGGQTHEENVTMTVQDTTDPIAYFGTMIPDGATSVSSTVQFDGKCTDDTGLSSLQIWGNWSGGWSPKNTTSSPTNNTWYNRTVTGIPDGTWRWAVYCVDTSANDDFEDTNRTFTVNTGVMTINILSPELNKYYNDDNIWFNVTTTETASTCQYSLDGAANVTMTNSTGNWNKLDSSVAEGARSVRFYCNDTFGTWATAATTFYVDLTNPLIYTNQPSQGSNWTSSNTVTFNLRCTDNLGLSHLILYGNWSGSWAIEQDNDAPSNTSWWNPTESIPNGVYQWAAWCNDSSGRTNSSANITFTVAYVPSPGGGGGGGGTTCTVYSGTCFNGNSCPSGYTGVTQGSCGVGSVCCKSSVDVCVLCRDFIDQYSMLSFSTFEFDNFFTTVSNQTNITKEELKDTIINYNEKCGNYCFLFGWPVIGKYLEMFGRAVYPKDPCLAAIILLIAIVVGIIYYFYKRNKKKRRYR